MNNIKSIKKTVQLVPNAKPKFIAKMSTSDLLFRMITQSAFFDFTPDYFAGIVERAQKNLSCPAFDLTAKGYYRNDIRRFLSCDERKMLSRQIGKMNNHRLFGQAQYRVICRTLGNLALNIA